MPADAVLTTQAYRANETGKRTEPFAEVHGLKQQIRTHDNRVPNTSWIRVLTYS